MRDDAGPDSLKKNLLPFQSLSVCCRGAFPTVSKGETGRKGCLRVAQEVSEDRNGDRTRGAPHWRDSRLPDCGDPPREVHRAAGSVLSQDDSERGKEGAIDP